MRKTTGPFPDEVNLIFENVHDAIFLVERRGGEFRYIRNNPAHKQLSGLLDMEGKTPVELLGEKLGRTLLANYERCVAAGKRIDYEQTLYFPTGKKIWLTSLTPVFDDGEIRWLIGSGKDITELKEVQNELFQEKELLQATLSSIGDGVVTTDGAGVITSLNDVAQDITGWNADDAVGRPFAEVFQLRNEETGQLVESPIQKVLETGRIVGLANHTELVSRQGLRIPIADSAAPIKRQSGEISGVVMVFRDVSLEKEHYNQIEYLSYHDALTGLYNRRYLEASIGRMDLAENLPFSVVMGDVNGLKITNDIFGHGTGDTLLKHVARLLGEHCRKNDVLARWGGDEFVVLMPQTSLKEAETMIDAVLNDAIVLEESGLRMSISLGGAAKDAVEKDIHAVIREAEENMYHQKLLKGESYRSAIIDTLLTTLYEKSMETEEHSKRMEEHCHLVGRQLKLTSKEMDDLSLLALLHDIGKVGINTAVLKKPGALTPEEWQEMKRHPEIGYRIVQATSELAKVADLVLSHHERWDGKGYPRGLRGKEIPLACRILSVADAYDAMTNDRVYRKAMSGEAAAAELRENAGTQFDPDIVEVFARIVWETSSGTLD